MGTDSPEERLLRLIKGKSSKKDGIRESAHIDKGPGLSEWFKKTLTDSRIFNPSFLKVINKALAAVLLILVLCGVYSLLASANRDAGFIGRQKEKPYSETASAGQDEPKQKDYSLYSSQIQGKQLFGPSSADQTSGREKYQQVDMSKKFNLVGIIAGEKPQAIIEDSQTQKTYYLYTGQSFNDVTVEEISNGRVVLDCQGEKIILVL